jgi:hypothetical protein
MLLISSSPEYLDVYEINPLPPLHASSLIHVNIFVELTDSLQYPLSMMIISLQFK